MRPGAGAKVSGSSALMRHSSAWPKHAHLVLGQRQFFAARHADLLLHDVDAGGHLGHRVFHLQPGVHLDEKELAVLE
jgi:hypothetical protein